MNAPNAFIIDQYINIKYGVYRGFKITTLLFSNQLLYLINHSSLYKKAEEHCSVYVCSFKIYLLWHGSALSLLEMVWAGPWMLSKAL